LAYTNVYKERVAVVVRRIDNVRARAEVAGKGQNSNSFYVFSRYYALVGRQNLPFRMTIVGVNLHLQFDSRPASDFCREM
jgi:hypothetical protein